jgi:hypothetical protein
MESPLAEKQIFPNRANRPVSTVDMHLAGGPAADAAEPHANNARKGVRTSEATRQAIQASDQTDTALARLYHVNRKTVAKWKARQWITATAPMGPKTPQPRLLTAKEEVIIAAYRRRTRLSLEDCLDQLRRLFPKLTRSSLYRCLRRYGLSKIGATADAPPISDEILSGPFRFDITLDLIPLTDGAVDDDVPLGKGEVDEKGHLAMFYEDDEFLVRRSYVVFMAIEETTKQVYADVFDYANAAAAAQFMLDLVERTPQKVISVTTEEIDVFGGINADFHNNIAKAFSRACTATGVSHRRTRRLASSRSRSIGTQANGE